MYTADRPRKLTRRELLAGLGAAAALPVLAACSPNYDAIVDAKVKATRESQPQTPSPEKAVVTPAKVAVASSPQTNEHKEDITKTTWSRQVLIPPLKNGSGWLPASFATTSGAPQEKIFFTNPNGQIEAVDLTGKTLWKDENNEKKTLFRGAYGWNKIVYAAQSGNRIYALDADNGQVSWTLNFSDYPQLQGTKEYSLNTPPNTIELTVTKGYDKASSLILDTISLDKHTRKIVWSMPGKNFWYFKDTTVIETKSEDSQTIILTGIVQDTGKEKWKFSYPTPYTPEGTINPESTWFSFRDKNVSVWVFKAHKTPNDKILVAYRLDAEKVTEVWRRTLPSDFNRMLVRSRDRLYFKVKNSIFVWDQESNRELAQLHDNNNNGKFNSFTELNNTVFWRDDTTTPSTLHGYNFSNRNKWETKKVGGSAIGEAKGLVIFMQINSGVVLFSGVEPTTGQVKWSTSGKTDLSSVYNAQISSDQIIYQTKQGLAYCKIGESKPPEYFYSGVTTDRFDIFAGWAFMEIGNRGEMGILSAVKLP